MARIIENKRRIIKLSTDDILSIVREYQSCVKGACCYDHVRELLDKKPIYICED